MCTRTLASNDLDSHAGMVMPGERVKLDESRHHWFIQVNIMRRIRVCVTFEHLTTLHQPDVFTRQISRNNVSTP